jgi:hypothetical protein
MMFSWSNFFKIKYGLEYFKIRNNFPYWIFSSKFGLEFELKIRECSRCLIGMNFVEFDGALRIDAI